MPQTNPNDPTQTDYVAHGSDEHAGMIGLRKATKDDPEAHVYEGWTLADLTLWGPAATEIFLRRVLMSKVNELKAKVPKVQSQNSREANYAPPMWTPGLIRE